MSQSGMKISPQSSQNGSMDVHNGMTRSPPESPRSSFAPSNTASAPIPPGGRRYSLNLPPEVLEKMAQRRASLEKLHVDKVSPWMHLYDFTEDKDDKETSE